MGHIRLGTLPKSKPWHDVVGAFLGPTPDVDPVAHSEMPSPAIPQIAAKTLDAARGGLENAIADEGLRYAFYLLTQIALASREEDWRTRLRELGLALSERSTVFDLSAAFQNAVDDHLITHGWSSDISEIAQRAAGDALGTLAGPRAETLFGNAGEELRLAVRTLSTKNGFATLGQHFFGHFLARFLNFYLSRATAATSNRGPIEGIGDISQFNSDLVRHCEQSAAIVHDFAGEWYSKTEYQKGIDPQNAAGFVAIAVKKLQAELQGQRAA